MAGGGGGGGGAKWLRGGGAKWLRGGGGAKHMHSMLICWNDHFKVTISI